jgi:FkbM family methyltransferase
MPEKNSFVLQLAAAGARILPASVKRLLYRFPPLAKAIRTSLNRAAPQELTSVTVAAGALAGSRLLLNLQSEKDYWLGAYEADLQKAIADWVQPGWVAYDVGANIGYLTLILAKAVGYQGRVVAFEALPGNVDRLRQNLTLNPEITWVDVVNVAVVDSTQPVNFLVDASHKMGKAQGSAGREKERQAILTLDGLSLDDYVFKQGHPAPHVIKMDIEGGEVLALPGMRHLLQEYHPLLLLELHGEVAARVTWEELTRPYQDAHPGYRLLRMHTGYPPVPSLSELDWKSYLVASPLAHSTPEKLEAQ